MRLPSSQGLTVHADGVRVCPDLRSRAAHVCLDGDPVVPLARFARGGFVGWPGGVVSRLPELGLTSVSLVTVDGVSLVDLQHDFGGTGRWSRPTDSRGRSLALNKWGWWDLPLGARSDLERSRALADLSEVLRGLASRGRPAWIAGGTLLGAVRAGAFIPHDDDVDVAYLASSGRPGEVALESFALERHFVSQGWQSRRFTGAHFQLVGDPIAGRPPIHVDVFSAFFTGRLLNQPFHIRGPFSRDRLLPLGDVVLAGARLPAPRDVDGWLELNYGADWRTPQPNHVLGTPEAVARLFSGWFGHYQGQLEYWQDRREQPITGWPSASAAWLAQRLERGTTILELGCGDGADARFLAGQGFPVLATDFLVPPGPAGVPESGATFSRVNVADPRDLMELAVRARVSGRRIHVHSRHLADRVEPSTRRIMLAALRHFPEDATFSMTVDLASTDRFDPRDPSASQVSWRSICRDSRPAGIAWRRVSLQPMSDQGSALLWGERSHVDTGSRLRRVRDLPRSLREVRAEIAELRHVPLRLAELQDFVVNELAEAEPRTGGQTGAGD